MGTRPPAPSAPQGRAPNPQRLLLIITLAFASPFVRAGSVEVFGAIGGRITQEETDGAITYVARGLNLEIEQHCTDGNSYLLARAHMPGFIHSFVRRGTTLYLGVVDKGLYILDALDPTNPRTVGRFADGVRWLELSLDGTILGYASGYKRVSSAEYFDISDPLRPKRIPCECGSIGSSVSDYHVINGILYRIIENELSTCLLRPGAGQGTGSSLKLPLIQSYQGFYPTVSLKHDEARKTLGVVPYNWVKDETYQEAGELIAVDISDPEHPAIIGTKPNPTAGSNPFEEKKKARPKARGSASPPRKYIHRVSRRNALQEARVAAVYGNTVALGDETGLTLVDITDKTRPRVTGTLAGFKGISSIALAGSFAYFCSEGGGLNAVDISKPSKPHITKWVTNWGTRVNVANGHAYLWIERRDWEAGWNDPEPGIAIFDLSTPATPRKVGSLKLPGNFAAAGKHGYLVYGGLRMFDLSDAARPVEVASLAKNSSFPASSGPSNRDTFMAWHVIAFGPLALTTQQFNRAVMWAINSAEFQRPVRFENRDGYQERQQLALSPHWAWHLFHSPSSGGGDDTAAFQTVAPPEPFGPPIPFDGLCSPHGSIGPISPVADENDFFYMPDGGGGLVILRPSTSDETQPEVMITTAP